MAYRHEKQLMEELTDHPFVREHRLPVVRSTYPAFYYFTAWYYPEDPSHDYEDNEVPTDEELMIAVHYNKYCIKKQGFYERYLQEMREKAIVDIDNGGTKIFNKSKKIGWQYRVGTWRHGPFPFFDSELRFENLIDLLDHIEKNHWGTDRWQNYKDRFPEIFPV